MKRKLPSELRAVRKGGYADFLGGLTELLEEARHAAARSINAVLTASYWEVGRRIVEFEQVGAYRAAYGQTLLKRLSRDLSSRFGRGFSEENLRLMRLFYLGYREPSHRMRNPRHYLADFLLELGYGFTFVARQKRFQIGSESYYLDLLFYHRSLRCLVAIDLKVGKFTHADAGQMNLYLNYLRENETLEEEAAPVGLVLCTEKDEAVAHYALGGLSNKVFASRYKLQLPAPEILKREIEAERRRLERGALSGEERDEQKRKRL